MGAFSIGSNESPDKILPILTFHANSDPRSVFGGALL